MHIREKEDISLERYFPIPLLFKTQGDIVCFWQNPEEYLYGVWLRFKKNIATSPKNMLPDAILVQHIYRLETIKIIEWPYVGIMALNESL